MRLATTRAHQLLGNERDQSLARTHGFGGSVVAFSDSQVVLTQNHRQLRGAFCRRADQLRRAPGTGVGTLWVAAWLKVNPCGS